MKKILSLILVFLFITAPAAIAEDALLINLDYNTQNNTARVYGELGGEYKNLPVSLFVVKGKWENDSTAIKSDIENKTPDALNWYDMQIAGENGWYDFTYAMTGTSGADYSVLITVPNNDTINYKTFTFFDSNEPLNLMKRYAEAKKADDSADIEDIISTRKDYLQLDTSVYDTLTDEEVKSNVAKSLLACDINVSSSDEFISDFKAEFVNTSKVWALNIEEVDYKQKLADTLGNSAQTADSYLTEFETEVQERILTTMQHTDYLTMDNLISEYNRLVLTQVANDATVWGELHTLVTNAYAELELDLSDYNDLSDKSAAMKLMLKDSFTTLEDIKESFDSAVATRKSEEKRGGGNKNNSSSGGGSYGGGGAVVVPTPIIPSTESKETNELKDINDVSWAKEAISELHERKVVSGDENGNFLPNKVVNRAEFVKMLVVSMGYELVYNGTGYSDVDADAWYAPYIYAARKNGLVNGISEDIFAPEAYITRQDAVVMLYRAAKVKNAKFNTEPLTFDDSGDVAEYATEPVEAFCAEGYISGMGNNKFEPKSVATKAQAAKMIYNLFEGKELWGE